MKMPKEIGILLLVLFVSACSTTPPTKKMGVLVVAIAGDHVFVGEALSWGYKGSFTMTTITKPTMACHGRFRYRLRSDWGKAYYSCDNDMEGSLRISPEGVNRGSGTGLSDLGPMEALFGYSLYRINERLVFPNQKHLVYSGKEFVLVDAK